ncbi:hypothetical protein ANCDUO_25047 [Ancylostoma duodenale]|uniref:Uncharacterized protein n=1 Tax=Ancylostoma duodenale TaxID=51022 RepID=A0A0C2F8Y9_9BILA|nr:hypothetical protein ANCDUO_25047 [Ancylostoma duodenale]
MDRTHGQLWLARGTNGRIAGARSVHPKINGSQGDRGDMRIVINGSDKSSPYHFNKILNKVTFHLITLEELGALARKQKKIGNKRKNMEYSSDYDETPIVTLGKDTVATGYRSVQRYAVGRELAEGPRGAEVALDDVATGCPACAPP